ncbi:MAG: hypothetical protein KDC87_09830 [Planctomycetes bacterium]|nr:hypothetical protein [Planctomycetota bacterium]MCB9868289.1 hypothetical protein [Planctomycetota bacterium]
MQSLNTTLLCAAALASFVSAQAGPTFIDQDPTTPGVQPYKVSTYFTGGGAGTLGAITTPFPIWSASAASKNIVQVSLGKTGILGLGAGEYHMCMTTYNLNSGYMPTGSTQVGQQVIMGKVTWNSGQPVFTPNTMAKNLCNPSGDCFGLMISGDTLGQWAALDWSTGVYLGYRANSTVDFDAPVPVAGVTGPWVDPAVGHLDGKLVLFWADAAGTIVYAPLSTTLTAGKLTAASVGSVKTAAAISGEICHSPTPVFDGQGNAIALWFAARVSNDSDMYFASNIESNQKSIVKVWDNINWLNNGGVAGGRFLAADSTNYSALVEGQGFYMATNTEIAVGPSAQLTVQVGAQSGTPSVVSTTFAVALGVNAPITLGGIEGGFALTPTPLLFLVPVVLSSTTKDDVARASFPATDVSLKGLTLYFQGVANPVDATVPDSFTSTAATKFN